MDITESFTILLFVLSFRMSGIVMRSSEIFPSCMFARIYISHLPTTMYNVIFNVQFIMITYGVSITHVSTDTLALVGYLIDEIIHFLAAYWYFM